MCVCCGALDGPRDQFGLRLFIQFIQLTSTSFTAEAHSVFSCDYVHSVHEFHFVPNRCVGVCTGSGCRAGVLFGEASGAVDGLEGEFGVARMF